jgi:hypothetical protein
MARVAVPKIQLFSQQKLTILKSSEKCLTLFSIVLTDLMGLRYVICNDPQPSAGYLLHQG